MAKVFIADDSADLLQFLAILLKVRNFEVETASSKNDIAKKLPLFVPDVILLDVKLHGEDGRDICRDIKSEKIFEHIPVILLSAAPQLLADYDEYNANDIIEKPFNINTLLSKINKQLNGFSHSFAMQC